MNQETWHLPDPDYQSDFYEDVKVKRLLAYAIDILIVIGLNILVFMFAGLLTIFFFPLVYSAVGFIYRVVTLSAQSATLGMRLMAIEFRDRKGRMMDTELAALHTFGFYLSCWFFPLQIWSVYQMANNERGQGLSDQILQTVLINKRANT